MTRNTAPLEPYARLGLSPSQLWKTVEESLCKNFETPDIEAAKLIFASVAAHRIASHPPAWIMAIAPSGSMKTAILHTLEVLPGVTLMDEVTPNTFISGYIRERDGQDESDKKKAKQKKTEEKKPKPPASLLHRLGKAAIVIVADFSTFLSMDRRKGPVILAQLRRIYDGQFSREFGTGENLTENGWNGRLTLLAGVTPEVDRHYTLQQALGERFLRARWARAGGVASGIRAMRQRSSVATEMRNAVHALLRPILSAEEIPVPRISEEYEARIACMGELVALARAHVPRLRNTHEIDGEPAPEGNTRLPQQLAQIGRGWAVLEGSDHVTDAGMGLIDRVAFDCIPPIRCAVLRALIAGKNPYAQAQGQPPVLVERAVEDLEAIGLVEKKGRDASLSPTAISLLRGAGVTFPQSGNE